MGNKRSVQEGRAGFLGAVEALTQDGVTQYRINSVTHSVDASKTSDTVSTRES